MNAPLVGQTHLAKIVADELGFYRQLFNLIDKQRETIEEHADVSICDLFDGIRQLQERIEESERALQAIRRQSPDQYRRWVQMPQIAANLKNITELVERALEAIAECTRLAHQKRREYRRELSRMNVGRVLLSTLAGSTEQPRFVDHRP